jgi:C1A family cysteine protease
MKTLVALVCGIVLALAVPVDVQKQFVEWQREHGRFYQTQEERAMRMQNFYVNSLEVAMLNNAESHRTTGAVFKLNKFGDWSEAELQTLRGFRAEEVNTTGWRNAAPLQMGAPDSVDWRTNKNVVAAIKDQGACGSCWAFSATFNTEAMIGIKNAKLTTFSEQFLVDCDHNCGQYRVFNGCDAGCGGGLMPNAWKYVMDNGQPTDNDYPYHARAGTCDKSKTPVAKITNWEFIDINEDTIATYVANKGPAAIAVDASHWSSYHGGIMQSLTICPKGGRMNHAVAIVGYGTESGTPYWIVRNSWGVSWGESGYARLIRGTSFCSIDQFACSVIV